MAVRRIDAQLGGGQLTHHRTQQCMGGTVAQRVIGQRLVQAKQAVIRVGMQQGHGFFLDVRQPLQGVDGQTALVQDATQHLLQVQPAAVQLASHHIVALADLGWHGHACNLLHIHTAAQQLMDHALVGTLPGLGITGRGRGIEGMQLVAVLLRHDGLALA